METLCEASSLFFILKEFETFLLSITICIGTA